MLTKDKIKEEWLKAFQPPERIYIKDTEQLSCPLCGVKAEEIADWWLAHLSAQYEKLIEEVIGEKESYSYDREAIRNSGEAWLDAKEKDARNNLRAHIRTSLQERGIIIK